MRITSKVVETIAKEAETLSNGAFRLQGVGGDIGHGTRYIDGIRQLVWVGRGASQKAAAYYLGAVMVYADAKGIDLRERTEEFGTAYSLLTLTRLLHTESAEQGRDDARSRREITLRGAFR